MKKVSWPTAKTVAKNTGIVLLVVLFFALLLLGVDTGFMYLIKLISNL